MDEKAEDRIRLRDRHPKHDITIKLTTKVGKRNIIT
jgi:hypothetical protein